MRRILILISAVAITACMPLGDPPGAGAAQLGPVSAGPAGNLDVPPGDEAVIPLDDIELPGVMASDGIVDVCAGALIAAQATVVDGWATLRAEAGQRGGPWSPFVQGETIPLHTVPLGARAVRVVVLAGDDGAELAGGDAAPRPTHVTVLRSCQQGDQRPGIPLEEEAGTDRAGEGDDPHAGPGLVGAAAGPDAGLTAAVALSALVSGLRHLADE